MNDNIDPGRVLIQRAIAEKWELFSPDEINLMLEYLREIRAESKARGDVETADTKLVRQLPKSSRLQIADRCREVQKEKQDEVIEIRGALHDLEQELRAMKHFMQGEDQD